MKKSFILISAIFIAGCTNENTKLLEANFTSMDSCLSKLKGTANQPLRIITDEPKKVSGFYGEQDLLFLCQTEESGTHGVYVKGMIEILEHEKHENTASSIAEEPTKPVLSSKEGSDIIGNWYDDVGSPDYLNARIYIKKEGKKYIYHRVNGDGSKGKFLLVRSGNVFKRADGKFGSIYIMTSDGLEMHDTNGYIRTAKPD